MPVKNRFAELQNEITTVGDVTCTKTLKSCLKPTAQALWWPKS